MGKEEIIKQAQRILEETQNNYRGSLAQAKELIKNILGVNSSFFQELDKIKFNRSVPTATRDGVRHVLKSFINYVHNDLLYHTSFERKIQIETVSDYLDQARILLEKKGIHPAAPAVIIGASLEEFLRNWLEETGSDMGEIKPNLDSYAKELRSMELIDKQDLKDITSWGGIRNDAAHGRWKNVEDKNRIKIMLEGVNLFMRKHSE